MIGVTDSVHNLHGIIVVDCRNFQTRNAFTVSTYSEHYHYLNLMRFGRLSYSDRQVPGVPEAYKTL